MRLSILIKTYNEEVKIDKCIRSVLDAVEGITGGVEIIVADSLSTDATVEIARLYSVKLVQLRVGADRGCGAGVQLGFQHACGRYVYLLDGDMELQRSFLWEALEILEREEDVAGIGGVVQDRQNRNWFDRYRIKKKPSTACGEMEWLGGGGLYRRTAIEDAGGYAGNRNLKAYEEAELGLRLRSRGWRLLRISTLAIFHTGHAESTWPLMRRHWRSGRLDSAGVLLRLSVDQPWRLRVVRLLIHPLATLVYWATWILSGVFVDDWRIFGVLAAAGLAVYLMLVFRKWSFIEAGMSLLLWHVAALGLVRGLIRLKLYPPDKPIPSIVLSEGKPRMNLNLAPIATDQLVPEIFAETIN